MAFCSNCGASVAEGMRVCPQCGRETAPARAAAPPLAQAQEGLSALLDFSFTSFVTIKIIKFLYGLAILVAAVASLFLIVTAFSASVIAGILVLLIGAPLYFVLIVMVARVWLEILIVIFRIEQHTAQIAARG